MKDCNQLQTEKNCKKTAIFFFLIGNIDIIPITSPEDDLFHLMIVACSIKSPGSLPGRMKRKKSRSNKVIAVTHTARGERFVVFFQIASY